MVLERLSVVLYSTEKTKFVRPWYQSSGSTLPPDRVLVCPPQLVHARRQRLTTLVANGALKPSTIVAINDGTSRPNTGRMAG